MSFTQLFEWAIDRWGTHAQLQMLVEEAGELIVALHHYFRKGTNKNLTKVLEEMADVEIMLEQAKHIFGNPEMLEEFKKHKLDRLRERLSKQD